MRHGKLVRAADGALAAAHVSALRCEVPGSLSDPQVLASGSVPAHVHRWAFARVCATSKRTSEPAHRSC